jgi:hypothetical protein
MGNFQENVFADNEAGFAHFVAHHEPQVWDYQDI